MPVAAACRCATASIRRCEALVANLELLARRDFAALRRICGVDEEDLLDMMAEIRALDPRPGLAFSTGASDTIVADVMVRAASDGSWQVELNADALPRVLVDHIYFAAGLGRTRRTRRKRNSWPNACRTPTG